MSTDTQLLEALEEFILDEVIDEVVTLVKPGKEGVVYLARKDGDPPLLVAAKVYRDLEHRSFRRDGVYRRGRSTLDERLDRAMARGTRTGLRMRAHMWVSQERDALRELYTLGADVPRFLAAGSRAILMEFIGDEDGPAPCLHDVRLSPQQAEAALEQIVNNLGLFLEAGLVHADLSPYNILYWQGAVRIIDFPQSVELYLGGNVNPAAPPLLVRDVTNVCDYFTRRGVRIAPAEVLQRLHPYLPQQAHRYLHAPTP